jgi:hypothetical protein
MKTTKRGAEAVVVEDGRATLDVHYSITGPSEYSDANRFSEIIGGRNDTTEAQATEAVLEAARAWANGMRGEGHDIGVWDDAGNHY